MKSRRLNWLFGYQAVVYAAGLLLVTGLVPDWGVWYSSSLPYRTQTEAFLNGDLAVSRDIEDLKFDHTWSEQGVHQVWGLGIPLWRLPFELAAKACGFEMFPDRIAFGLFALLVCFVVLKFWLGVRDGERDSQSRSDAGWRLVMGFGAGFIVFLLFPPFLTLLQVRGAVWEEAVAYEYLFGVLQLTLLLAFVRQPNISRLFLVCALAGLGGLIRPTLVFYGFATVVIATVVWVFKSGTSIWRAKSWRKDVPTSETQGANLQDQPKLGRVLGPALFGLFLFCLGGGVLWLTNLNRFGDGFEFGHQLNVQTLYGSMYATRFDDPFQDEPLPDAARELFGALFFVEQFNGADWYQENIFRGQSPTVRWREFYFRTYDWSYLPLLLLGWGGVLAVGFRLGRRKQQRESDQKHEREMPSDQVSFVVIGLWSLLCSLLLAGFFLYTPVISSRYLMDFAPAFAASLAGAWLFLSFHCTKLWSRILACLLLFTWLGLQLVFSHSFYGTPRSVTAAELNNSPDQSPIGDNGTNSHSGIFYGYTLNDQRSAIPFDRTGWDSNSGDVMPLIILFVNSPEFLELEFEVQPHPRIKADPEDIRAKVGLERLERSQATKTENGWRIRFQGPKQERWREGLQCAFVATVPKQYLAERSTPWVLKSVRWRSTSSE